MFKHIVRFFIVVFWMAVIYLFLLSPYVEKYFYNDDKSLCIYTWSDRIDESVIREFEQKKGIKVHINNYESNEELLTKLERMPYVDCDIILPTGYIVDAMIKSKLIKKIDRSRCDFIDRIYPEFAYDEKRTRDEYCIGLYWDVLGIGYNKHRVGNRDVSLDMAFKEDKVIGHQLGMIDDARQSIFLAALYLGYSFDDLSKDKLREMRMLLKKQKQWVGAYSDSQHGYFLASKTFPVVVSDREHVCRQMLNHDFIEFGVPQEGGMLSVDNIVISSSSKKDDLVYEFINYLCSYEVLKKNCEKLCILPVIKDVFESLDKKYIGVEGLYPGSELFKKLKMFKNTLTHKEINDFWVRLKSL